MTNCKEAAALFAQYLDRELTPENIAHIERHLEACKDCFGYVEFDKTLRRALKKMTDEGAALPEELWQKIIDKIRS